LAGLWAVLARLRRLFEVVPSPTLPDEPRAPVEPEAMCEDKFKQCYQLRSAHISKAATRGGLDIRSVIVRLAS
jgi:hypothetical protein